jgi:ComF family protein
MCRKPSFDQAISVFEYNDFSRGMILRFKHQDATHLSDQFAGWMYRAAEQLMESMDLLIPVPIHFRRLLERKYNQSELLARDLQRLSGLIYEPRILIKSKPTPRQEGLTRKRREKNITGSFDVDKKYQPLLAGKNVLLVDDVFTTGSTVDECSSILKKHGASSVVVLTLAKVVLSK